MKKKTIIYIGGFELPDKNAAAHRVVNNAKALRDLGYNVVFIGTHKKESRKIQKDVYFDFTAYSTPYPNTKISWFKYITELNDYQEIIELYKDVHSLILYNLPAISIKRLIGYSKNRDIKLYSDCTEWYEAPKEGNILMRIIKKLDIRYRMEHLHLQLDGVISISKFLHNYYINKNVKSILLPPLVDMRDEKWKKKEIIENSKLTNFVYAGSPFLVTNKSYVKDQLDVFIAAFHKELNFSQNFHLHIIGVTLKDFLLFYPHLQKEMKDLDSNLTFYGRKSHLFVLDLLKKADFSIFYREKTLTNTAGFPTKLVEAISSSTAVITNSTSNISDYLVEGENSFLIPDNNVVTIDNVIHEVLGLDEYRKANIKKYKEKNCLIFDYRNYLNEFKEFLK